MQPPADIFQKHSTKQKHYAKLLGKLQAIG